MAAREKTNGLRLRVLGDQGTRCERSLCRKHARSDRGLGVTRGGIFAAFYSAEYAQTKRPCVMCFGEVKEASSSTTVCRRELALHATDRVHREISGSSFKSIVHGTTNVHAIGGCARSSEEATKPSRRSACAAYVSRYDPELVPVELLLRSWNELDTGFELGHWDGSGAAAQRNDTANRSI